MNDHGLNTGGAPAAPPAPSGNDRAGAVVEFPAPSAPLRVARQLAEQYRHECGLLRLGFFGGDWLLWTGSMWAELDHGELRSRVYRALERAEYKVRADKKDGVWELRDWNPTQSKVSNVVDALRAVALLKSGIVAPQWIGARTADRPRAGEIVSCANGLLHVPTRRLLEHTPAFFTRTAVPFDYDPDAPEPKRWLKFLESVWPNDPDSVWVLQEFFGYVLSGRTDMQKILLLIGPSRSGKGTIARVLAALVGEHNAAGPTLASLGSNFGLSPLLGKPLAIVADARLGGANTHQLVERLLSISGEDRLTVDRKYREPWTGRLPTRFVIISNELPKLGDASGAIANRFVVLGMARSFLGKEDHLLTDRLLAELPGILAWSLAGLERLTRSRSFTRTAASRDAVTALQDLASPVSAFVREQCLQEPTAHVDKDDLYAAWREWCERNGHRPTSSAHFNRDLRAVIPGLQDDRPRQSDRTDGKRPRRYMALRLKTASELDSDDDPGEENQNPPGPPGPHSETPVHGVSDEHGSAWTGPSGPDAGPSGPSPEFGVKHQIRAGGPSGPSETAPTAPRPDAQPALIHASDDGPPEEICSTCPNELTNPTSRWLGQCPGCHRVTDKDRRRYFEHLNTNNTFAG